MNELIILTAFIPAALLTLFKSPRIKATFLWFSVVLALICHGYFVFLHRDSVNVWFPAAVLFACFIVYCGFNKKLPVLTALSMVFLSQALLADNPKVIVILVAFADAFLCAELFLSSQLEKKNKAVRSIYRSALSLLPVTIGLLLRLDGDWFIGSIVATIVLRLFSWPLPHWISEIEEKDELFFVFVGAASSFAFWHTQDFNHQPVWSMVWLIIAAIFSIGARYNELYVALCFGAYAARPEWGMLFVAAWPLLLLRGRNTYLVTLLTVVSGAAIANEATKSLVENAAYFIVALSGLAIARVFVATTSQKFSWYWEACVCAVAGGLWAVIIALSPLTTPEIGVTAMVFGGAYTLFFIIGKIIFTKKKKPFLPAKGLSATAFSKEYISFEVLTEKPGKEILISEGRLRQKFFNILEGEGHLIFLFGLLGLALIWGLR